MRRPAFTLLELLVVLSIVGLIAAVAIPAASNAMRGASPRSSLTEVRSQLALARAEALRTGRAVEARMTSDSGSIVVAYAEREKQIRAVWLAENAEPTRPETVRFDSMGLADRREVQFVASRPEGAGASGIIWRLAFDPVSGAVGRPENTTAAKEDDR